MRTKKIHFFKINKQDLLLRDVLPKEFKIHKGIYYQSTPSPIYLNKWMIYILKQQLHLQFISIISQKKFYKYYYKEPENALFIYLVRSYSTNTTVAVFKVTPETKKYSWVYINYRF